MTDTSETGLPLLLPKGSITKQTREQIELSVAELIPEGKTLAVLGVADKDGIAAVVVAKMGTHWKLQGDFRRAWGGDVSGAVKVIGVY
jgi:hypothetical protein